MNYFKYAFVVVLLLIAGTWVGQTANSMYLEAVEKNSTVENQHTQIVDVDAGAMVDIQAPDKVKAGQLVVLDVSASKAASFKWTVVPATEDFMVIDGGKRAVFSHGGSGEFMFIVAVALGDTVDVKTHVVEVQSSVPKPTDTLHQKIASWCEQVESPTKRDDVLKLAQSFESVSAVMNDSMSPADMVGATSTSNRSALGANWEHWMPFLKGLQGELKAMQADGKLDGVEAHQQVWKDIADGLKQYANAL